MDRATEAQAPAAPSMKWSWRIGRFFGIDLYMHWTFLILVAWIALVHYQQSRSLGLTLQGILFILAIFACVVLHEYGHALTARKYSIRTRDITLLPIGGVASLERMPEDPRQELAIAVAGPLVNVVIALVLYVLLAISTNVEGLERALQVGGGLLSQLLYVNVALVLFNLVPAFPMDGGRVLRAALATRMEYARATQIAAGVGQALAIAFGFLAVFGGHWVLLFIAIFVYLGAEGESQVVTLRSTFRNVPVRDAMMTRFRSLDAGDPLQVAIEELLAGAQQDFPVTADGTVVGMLPRSGLLKSLADGKRDGLVSEVMQPEFVALQANAPLDRAFEELHSKGLHTAPVLEGGRLIGMLSLENIGEWAMIRSALANTPPPTGLARMAGVG